MLSTYDAKKFLKNKKDDDSFPFYEVDGKIYNKEDDKEICDLDSYVNYLRKILHCSFETVYYNHGSLTEILRCTECGAQLLEGDFIIQLFFDNEKASLTENAERVSAKKKLFFKWDINRDE